MPEPAPIPRIHIQIINPREVRVVLSDWDSRHGAWSSTGWWLDRASLEDLAEQLLFGREP